MTKRLILNPVMIFQVLDEVGIKPKRFAGASAGALCATMLAVGYSTAELKEVLQMNLDEVLIGKDGL